MLYISIENTDEDEEATTVIVIAENTGKILVQDGIPQNIPNPRPGEPPINIYYYPTHNHSIDIFGQTTNVPFRMWIQFAKIDEYKSKEEWPWPTKIERQFKEEEDLVPEYCWYQEIINQTILNESCSPLKGCALLFSV